MHANKTRAAKDHDPHGVNGCKQQQQGPSYVHFGSMLAQLAGLRRAPQNRPPVCIARPRARHPLQVSPANRRTSGERHLRLDPRARRRRPRLVTLCHFTAPLHTACASFQSLRRKIILVQTNHGCGALDRVFFARVCTSLSSRRSVIIFSNFKFPTSPCRAAVEWRLVQ